MQPDFRLLDHFPDLEQLTDRELSEFAGFWDDHESEGRNLDVIGWWLSQANHNRDRQP